MFRKINCEEYYAGCDVYILPLEVTFYNVEEYEHDKETGIFRFFNDTVEIGSVNDKKITKEDIIHLC